MKDYIYSGLTGAAQAAAVSICLTCLVFAPFLMGGLTGFAIGVSPLALLAGAEYFSSKPRIFDPLAHLCGAVLTFAAAVFIVPKVLPEQLIRVPDANQTAENLQDKPLIEKFSGACKGVDLKKDTEGYTITIPKRCLSS